MSSAFPNLFSPITLGAIQIPNRILMGSMHTGLEELPDGFSKMAAFYAARARGGVGLIVTGGIAPCAEGRVFDGAAELSSTDALPDHRLVTEAVHEAGGRICLQILHAGRYAAGPWAVAPSALKAPISAFKPRALSDAEVRETISAYARCAALASEAGYDGVEIMGSEGYLINEFLVERTNQREDSWGGDSLRRGRFPLEIVKGVRERVGPDFIILFRLSLLDLVEGGGSWSEVSRLAGELAIAGVTVLNSGIGWHEARVPTIAAQVPRATFVDITERLRREVSVPVVATNRINTAEVAESILARGAADMVSLARPLLADADFAQKARSGRTALINTCIACNQACLDHTFTGQRASCLVNPEACHELERSLRPVERRTRLGVVGGGPAGLACAWAAARRGFQVTLFEASGVLGGQLDLARRIPGKGEFAETLRFFSTALTELGVDIRLNHTFGADSLKAEQFDALVVATGVQPRGLEIPGQDHPKVMSYVEAILHPERVGNRVAILGAGGIGFDVALLLSGGVSPVQAQDSVAFLNQWGVNLQYSTGGGLVTPHAEGIGQQKIISLLQRKSSKPGAHLGKTTGWIHKAVLAQRGVKMIGGVNYDHVDDEGLHLRQADGTISCSEVDTVIVCVGQVSRAISSGVLAGISCEVHTIGGAREAAGIDAKLAILEGFMLARQL